MRPFRTKLATLGRDIQLESRLCPAGYEGSYWDDISQVVDPVTRNPLNNDVDPHQTFLRINETGGTMVFKAGPTASLVGNATFVITKVKTSTASTDNFIYDITAIIPGSVRVNGAQYSGCTLKIVENKDGKSGFYSILAPTADGTFNGVSVSFIPLVKHNNRPPVIGPFTGQTSGQVQFSIGDEFDPPDDIKTSATSSNSGMFQSMNVGGSGYSKTISLQPTQGAQGTATITVTATDADGASSSSQFDVTVSNGNTTTPPGNGTVNLAIQTIEFLDAAGQVLTVPQVGTAATVRVRWTGTGLRSADRYVVRFWQDDVPLDSAPIVNQSGTVADNWIRSGWTNVAPGTHTYRVTINPDRTLAENTYEDNSLVRTVTAGDQPVRQLPNLAIEAVQFLNTSGTPIPAPNILQQATVLATWTATGLQPTDQYIVRFWQDGVALDSAVITNQTGTVSGNWFRNGWPILSGGSHVYQVTVDADNTVAESNESDNTLARTVTPVSLPQQPVILNFNDFLGVQGGPLSGTFRPGEPINISFPVYNRGGVDAASLRVHYVLSSDNVIDAGDPIVTLSSAVDNAPVVAGQSRFTSATFPVPNVPVGTYRVGFVFDADADPAFSNGLFPGSITVISPPPPPNTPPIANPDSATPAFNTPISINVLANDTDANGDALAITGSTNPTNGTAIVNGGQTVTYTPNVGFSGNDTFSYTISDGKGGTATTTVTVVVSAAPRANTPPRISPLADVTAQLDQFPLRVPITIADDDSPLASVFVRTENSTLFDGGRGFIPVEGNGAERVLVFSRPSTTGTTRVSVIAVDDNTAPGSASFTITVTSPPPVIPPVIPPVVPPAPPPRLVGQSLTAVGSGITAQLLNVDRSVRFSASPFPGLTGGIRTSTADFNNDGTADIVVGTGPGNITKVQVLDGNTQVVLFSTQPFEASFTGGVYVASGDINGDGIADLAITPDEGGGPRVDVYSGNGFVKLIAFFGIDDPNFRGGARASAADMNGDGVSDLIVVAGFGGGPRVAAFDGKSLSSTPRKLFDDFFAFEQMLRNGVYVTAGDINGDGFADLIAGGGPGGGPRVLALDGKALLSNQYTSIANFFAGDPNSRTGVRLAVKNLDGDNLADLVIAAGDGSNAKVIAYRGRNIGPDGTPQEEFSLPTFQGAFVG